MQYFYLLQLHASTLKKAFCLSHACEQLLIKTTSINTPIL